ncbi:MAG TPA: NAD(P) transhydrogenase subunit alpha [Candidatus Dormibacteraeota bacterium]|nr:NAD(P) transhydrogenase subunit alpha [Candidatus Dormibacteraeota bacterium]
MTGDADLPKMSATAQVTVVGVLKESDPSERRVAVVPGDVARLTGAGARVLVEQSAGAAAWFPDADYAGAGASMVSRAEVLAGANVLLLVGTVAPDVMAAARPGQTVVGTLQPLLAPQLAAQLADRGVTAVSMDSLPRTLSRAQSMDSLTSQASIAGYKSVLIAANKFGRYLPMLMTAAGTTPPAAVLVLGVGVAGLQAIGTARRLGAVVSAYDVRPETREQVLSLGARFIDLRSVAAASGEGGYARSLTPEEQVAQQSELDGHIASHDIVITTAQVPGHRPPRLVGADAVARMRAGSVIVDMAASALGGNVELSQPGETIVTGNGVTIVAPLNLPAQVATGASMAYSHNIVRLLLSMVHQGRVVIDLDDEIQAAVVITYERRVVNAATHALLATPATQVATQG